LKSNRSNSFTAILYITNFFKIQPLKRRNDVNEITQPVYDLVGVQKLQSKRDTRGIETGALFAENIVVNVAHQIAAHRVLHHEKHVFLIVNPMVTVVTYVSHLKKSMPWFGSTKTG